MGCSICGQQQEGQGGEEPKGFAAKLKSKTIGDGENFEPKGLFAEKLSGNPVQKFEIDHLPFGTLLCEVFERECLKIKEEHEDYDEPFITIGAMKKAFADRKYFALAFAKDEKEPVFLFLKHEFLRAQRKDGLIVPESTDNTKLSLFKMQVVCFLYGAGKPENKAKVLEHIVNEEKSAQITWTDPEQIDAINFSIFMSTILIQQVEQAYLESQGKPWPAEGRLSETQIYKTTMFANMFDEFLQAIYGASSRLDREEFIAKVSAKENKWISCADHMRQMIKKGFTRSSDDLMDDLDEFKRYKPMKWTPTQGNSKAIENDIEGFDW